MSDRSHSRKRKIATRRKYNRKGPEHMNRIETTHTDEDLEEIWYICQQCLRGFQGFVKLIQHKRDSSNCYFVESSSESEEEEMDKKSRTIIFKPTSSEKCEIIEISDDEDDDEENVEPPNGQIQPDNISSDYPAKYQQSFSEEQGHSFQVQPSPSRTFRLESVKRDAYNCILCSNVFPNEAALVDHLENSHGNTFKDFK